MSGLLSVVRSCYNLRCHRGYLSPRVGGERVVSALGAWWRTWWPLVPPEPRDDGTTHIKAGTVAFDHSRHWSEQKRRGERGLVVSVSTRGWHGSVRFGAKWRGWPRIEIVPK